MEQRKKALRYRKRIEVEYGQPGQMTFRGYSGNLSHTGIMIRAVRVFGAGTILDLELRFPHRLVKAKGRVKWAREGSVQYLATGRVGMGIQFLEPAPDLADLV
ncbi:MAG: PilZ domain-containing protein [Candidatus Polarisedimenticolia bacterium]